MSDQQMARIARRLAEAMKAAAYSRQDEDKKIVTLLTVELCQLYDDEQIEVKIEPQELD